jgi:hypothetical protein
MRRFFSAPWLFGLGVLIVFSHVGRAAHPIVREPGVIYLSDFGIKPTKVKLLKPSPCYFDGALTRYAGTLRFPQALQLDAVAADGMYRVRGNAQQGGVVAWANPESFEPLPEKFLENLRKSEERRVTVEALIARNEAAIGMTLDEIGRSLGKPQKKTSRASKEGTQQVYEYIKYELVPQTAYAPGYNQSVVTFPGGGSNSTTLIQGGVGYSASTIYVKVPVGKLAVTFKDGLVEALEQTEGTTTGGQVSVVVPPINVLY